MCLFVLVVLAVTGFSKAQRIDQTSHNQQRAADRERDPSGQTAGLQQGYIIMSHSTCVSVCVRDGVIACYCVYCILC